MSERQHQPYRSLFWPLVLIGLGAFWLLVNFDVIAWSQLRLLLRLWPLLLIAIGLDIVIGRRSPVLSALIAIAVVAAAVVLVVIGPSMGWTTDVELQTERYTDVIGQATSAVVTLDLSDAHTTVQALTDSENLFDATLTYVGTIDFVVSGSTERSVELSHHRDSSDWWQRWPFGAADQDWEIGLTPEIPLALTVGASSGGAVLDLSDLWLRSLTVDASSGGLELSLPAVDGTYEVRIDGSSGGMEIDIADHASIRIVLEVSSGEVEIRVGEDVDLDLQIDGSSGNVVVIPSEDAAVQVDVRDDSSGDVQVPRHFDQVDDGNDNREDTGVWETPGYDDARYRISILVVEMSSGDIIIR